MSTATEAKTSLGQTEIWVDQRGVEHGIDEMSVRYKANVVRFLERRAPGMVARALAARYFELVGKLFEPVPCVLGEMPDGTAVECGAARHGNRWEHGVDHLMLDYDKYPDEVDAMIPDLPTVTNDEAVDMVRRTPLVQRLIADVEAGAGGDDG